MYYSNSPNDYIPNGWNMGYPGNNIPSPTQMGQMPSVQPLSVPPFNGKLITKIEDITDADIPSIGRVGIFPIEDYSSIIVKKWNTDRGNLDTIEFVPKPKEEGSSVETDGGLTLTDLAQTLNDLTQSVDDIKKVLRRNNRSYNNNYKKRQSYHSNNNYKKEEVSADA